MEKSLNPLQNLVNDNIGDKSLSKLLGQISMGGVETLSKMLPDEISKALTKGFQGANFGKLFGDAFEDVLYNKFYKTMLDTVQKIGEVASKSWEKADQAAYTYGKRLGLTSTQVQKLRDDVIRLNDAGAKFGINYGKTLDEVIKLQSEFSAQLGRSVKLTNNQLKDIAALSAVVGDDMAVKFTAQLESFGLSTSEAGEMMTKMFNNSVKQGISLETYSKNVNDNLHLAQQYTFKKGVDGLVSMAENAAKMKLDMQQVVSLGNKLADGGVESAVNMAAELQVLGGAFTQFADPLGLLHDSLLDMEGLSDRLTGLVGQIGRFDKEQGRIVIDPFQQAQLRQASKSMGLDYGKLIESATQQAKRKEIETQMSGLSNIPKEYKELLMNTAQFQNGVAGVRGANGEFKKLASLNGDDLKSLANFAKSDSENIRDIATMLRGMTDIREGMGKEKENERAAMYMSQSQAIKGMYKDLGESKEALQKLVKIEMSEAVMSTLGSQAKNVGSKVMDIALSVVTKGKVKTHASGGLITNGESGREYLLNSAQQGEFIVNKSSVERYLPLLQAINGDKNGGLLQTLFKPEEFLKENEDNIKEFIKDRLSSLREQKDSLSRELKNLSEGSKEYKTLLKKREKISSKWGKYMNLSKEASYDKKIATLAKKVKLGAKIGGGALAGVGAGVSAFQAYKADGTMVMNHGKAVGGTIGATAGAAIGTALGAFAGPIGMMIGGAIGDFAGKKIGEAVGSGNRTRRYNKRMQFSDEIGSKEGTAKFQKLSGDFSVKELKQIKNALADGKILSGELSNPRLEEKLKQTGNNHVFATKYANGGLLRGNSHANGGVILNEAEGGEFIVNKNSTANSMGMLTKINNGTINDSNIKPTEPMGKQMKVKETQTSNSSPQNIKMEPINININGTIKLDTGDKTFDISKELFNNPTLINKLTDIITKQMNIDDNFGFNIKNYKRKYLTI